MILENEDERKAWEFVRQLASMATDRICNDLEKEDEEQFKHLLVDCDDDGKIIQVPIKMDYDVLHWLIKQVKTECPNCKQKDDLYKMAWDELRAKQNRIDILTTKKGRVKK